MKKTRKEFINHAFLIENIRRFKVVLRFSSSSVLGLSTVVLGPVFFL